MYKLFSSYLENDYVIDLPINAAQLLTDEVFLKETSWVFVDGITGYKIDKVEDKDGYWCLTVQYWDGSGYDEEEFYMKKLILVDCDGVHREGLKDD